MRGLDRDVGELAGLGQLVHRGIRDEDRAAAGDHEREAEQALAGLGVDHAADVAQHAHVVAREAGDHGIGVALGDHAGAEDVAVLVDQALAVAEQQALALAAAVEELGVGAVPGAEAGVVDLEGRLGQAQARALRGLADQVLAADQHRGAEAGVAQDSAARMVFSSSPSAKTTRLGWARTRSTISCMRLAVGSRRARSWSR